MSENTRISQLKKQLEHKEKELYCIQRIGKALSSTLQLEELLRLIMQEITELMEADRATLYMVDYDKKEIWSRIALKAEVKEIRLPIGAGISGYVAETGETINIPDAYDDDRFDPATDKKTGYRTRSILCMPVHEPLHEGKIIGVIQLLNKRDSHFTSEDEALLEAIASQVAISIANSQLYERLDKKFREIDLLYDFEQLMNSVNALQEVLGRLLTRTMQHLQAELVLGIFPENDSRVLLTVDKVGQPRREVSTDVSNAISDFVAEPRREIFPAFWTDLQHHFGLDSPVDVSEIAILYSKVDCGEYGHGLLLAIDVNQGISQHYADEKKMLELVAQKVSRANELHTLRDTLLKKERLSAIGQLMSTVVHDIRGPVNTIYGFVDLIEDETTTGSERVEYANIIREEIRSTMNMITEVLDFAKGKTSILPRKSAVRDVLKRFEPRLQQMCSKHGIRLEMSIKSAAVIYADVEKLSRVFYNISKNALEAMEGEGEFFFKVVDQNGRVVFEFRDTGPGIPEDIRNRLFDSFVTSGKEEGSGLGLAIVKKIVDEHSGEIQIESEPGSGATFRIALPVHKK